jgi:hypothetical protein
VFIEEIQLQSHGGESRVAPRPRERRRNRAAMVEPDRPERFEIRVTDIEDPLPDGSIGHYVQARLDGLDEPFVPQLLVLG